MPRVRRYLRPFILLTLLALEAKAQTASEFVLSGFANGIAVYRVNSATGQLSAAQGSPFTTNPTFVNGITSDPQGRFIYAAHGLAGQVSGYNLDPNTGALSPVPGSPFGAGPLAVQPRVHPSGKFLYVTNEEYTSNQVTSHVTGYSIDQTTGALKPLLGSPFPTGVSGFDMAFDPTGSYAFVASNYGGLAVLSVNPASGALTAIPGSPFPVGFNLASVVVHPNGHFIFIADQVAQHLWALDFSAASLSLTPLPGSPYSAPFPHALAFGPGGSHLYATDNWTGLANAVSGYNVDPTTGALSQILGSPFQTNNGPAPIAVDPAGKFAYVTHDGSMDLWPYAVDQQTGAFIPTGQALPIGPAPDSLIVVSPSGASTVGTITVTSIPSGAGFQLNGPGLTYYSGTTPFTVTTAPPGNYKITWSILLDNSYIRPPSETKTLAAGTSISFVGMYCNTNTPLIADMIWNLPGQDCPANGPDTIVDAGYVKGKRLKVNWDRYGKFGASESLQAASGETLELWCGTLPGYTDYQYLLYYTAPGDSPHPVGMCVWPRGCNSAQFTYSGLVTHTRNPSQPGCFLQTTWISRDYGDNTLKWDFLNGYYNPVAGLREPKPVLDWYEWDYDATKQKLSAKDIGYQYRYGPPVPLCKDDSTPQGEREKSPALFTVTVKDPPLGPATDAFFYDIFQVLSTLPGGVASQSNRPLGDINGDGKIDMSDFVAFQQAFSSCSSNIRYNPYADIDHDGCVTFKDYQLWYQLYTAATQNH